MKTEKWSDQTIMEVRRRIGDYERVDFEAERAKLIALWKALHPEAAAEAPSSKPRPLVRIEEGKVDSAEEYDLWVNDIYQVNVRRWTKDRVFGTNGGMIQLGISCLDGKARHDWRDFQNIKNQLAGPECEAFELYPAESRLLDPSNYYTLWCFPGLKHIHVGIVEGRRVLDAEEALAPQRRFGKEDICQRTEGQKSSKSD